MSPLIDWLAWLGEARLASAWLSRPQTTATAPEEADKTTGAALRTAPVVVAAADETSHAEARRAKPSQASQSIKGLTNGFGYPVSGNFCLFREKTYLGRTKSYILGHFFEAWKVAEHVRAGIPCRMAAELRENEPGGTNFAEKANFC